MQRARAGTAPGFLRSAAASDIRGLGLNNPGCRTRSSSKCSRFPVVVSQRRGALHALQHAIAVISLFRPVILAGFTDFTSVFNGFVLLRAPLYRDLQGRGVGVQRAGLGTHLLICDPLIRKVRATRAHSDPGSSPGQALSPAGRGKPRVPRAHREYPLEMAKADQ